MKLKYSVTIDDLVAFNIFYERNSAFIKRSKLINGVVIPSCPFLVMCIVGISKHSWQPVFNGIIVSVSLILWTFLAWDKRTRKIYRKILKEGGKTDIEIFELEITADSLTEKGKHKETTWSWDSIGKIGSTPEHIFVYTSTATAIVIPQAGVIEGSYAEFFAELKQFFEKTINANQLQEHSLTDKIIIDPKKTCHTDTHIGEHSGLGIASLAISFLAAGLFSMIFLVMLVATIRGLDLSEPIMTAMGMVLMLGIASNLTGLGLGIAGLVNKSRKKTLSVLGVVCNCVILAVLTILVAFGRAFG
jgi:hypothetical protein